MYPIIEVPADKANLIEQIGTKPKFWYQKDDVNYMYKEVRPGTGEDWSEKAACELSAMLGIPHVHYDLAISKGIRGVTCQDFVPKNGRLVHGNELLARVKQNYEANKRYKARQYTLLGTIALIKLIEGLKIPIGCEVFEGVNSAIDIFLGYILLDAWIANQDRHHQNWGVVITKNKTVHLTPTYDHASSLGRNESDKKRIIRLTSQDKNRGMQGYIERAQSAFYFKESRLSTFDAFSIASRVEPTAAKSWLERLERISIKDIKLVFENIPTRLISDIAIDFAIKMIELNRERLLQLKEVL